MSWDGPSLEGVGPYVSHKRPYAYLGIRGRLEVGVETRLSLKCLELDKPVYSGESRFGLKGALAWRGWGQ